MPISIRSRLYLYLAPLIVLVLLLLVKSSAVYREMLDHAAGASLDARNSVFARRLGCLVSQENREFWCAVSTSDESDEDRWNEARGKVEATLSAWKASLHEEAARDPAASEQMELDLLLSIENGYARFEEVALQAFQHFRGGRSGPAASSFAELDDASDALQSAAGQLALVEETECREDLNHIRDLADYPGVTVLGRIPGTVSAAEESFSELVKTELFGIGVSGLMESVSDLATTDEVSEISRARAEGEKAERALADWQKWRAGLVRPRLAELGETERLYREFRSTVDPVVRDANLTTRRTLLRERSGQIDSLSAVLLSAWEGLQSDRQHALDSDLEHLFREVNRARVELALASLLVLVIAVGVPVTVSRRFVSPIVGIRSAFVRLEAGSLGARIDWSSQDEIGDLARGFNSMAESLAERDRRLRSEIDRRRMAEEEQAREAAVSKALADLAGMLLTKATIEDISELVLETGRQLTRSAYGFVGYIDPDTGYLVSPTMTREVWEDCRIEDKSVVFKEFVGLFGWVLVNRQSLLTNAPSSDSRSAGTPSGHVPLERFVSAPAVAGDILLGQVALANSEQAYTESDLALVESLADMYAIAIRRLRSEDEREQLVSDLQAALEKVRLLQGIIPICASCKKIRDDTGAWRQMELYIRDHSEAEFSHGICPECMKKLYSEFAVEKDDPEE